MANQRPTLKNDELRETHDELVGRVADQARQWGAATPDIDATQKWVADQMRQVEVSHEAERKADAFRPVDFDVDSIKQKAADIAARTGEKLVVTKEHLGDVTVGPDGVKSNLPRKRVKPSDRMRAVVRWLMNMPEWNARITTIVNTTPAGPQREEQLRGLIVQATKLYGNYNALVRAGLGKWWK